ncbi:ABC1 kinase family protein [Aneurinibacillus tyrosinisolvens]|uniref:ABC1 kinase family protein n=1 Tax=Aneurinibacillus tyrosinisolvens TaxID=1443435 RepID=UPI000699C689|nr:AarF/UbiB family protein [Aneurinibacillus tyrosinisolvens]
MIRNRYYRIFVIVAMTIRFFVEVWWFHRTHRNESRESLHEQWEALVAKQARDYKTTALRLGGLLIKMGQFLSTRADVMPRAFTSELSDLTDRVPSVPWEISKKIIEQELNQPIENVFTNLSTAPVASASIGEVYKGYLKTGQEVALKVQREGIEAIIDADFAATRVVIRLAKRFTRWGKTLDLDALYRELERTVSKELDFRKEYAHAKRFMEMYEDNPSVQIPRYYEEWMTRRILVMEWIEGAKVTNHAFLEANQIDKGELVQRLIRLFLQQVLIKGFFHADLHPGNIFIRSDAAIVLLDFGMVGEIKQEARKHIQTLIQAVVLKDYDLLVQALDHLRFLTPQADREQVKVALQLGLEMYLNRAFDNLDDETLEEIQLQIQQFVQVQPIQLPAEYAFLGRAFSTVVGVVTTIKPDVDFLEAGRPIVTEWLNQEGTKKDNRHLALQLLKDVAREISVLPKQLNRFIDASLERDYHRKKSEELNRWLEHHRGKQRAGLLFLVLGWGSALAFRLFHYPMETYICLGVSGIAFVQWLYSQNRAAALLKESGYTGNERGERK